MRKGHPKFVTCHVGLTSQFGTTHAKSGKDLTRGLPHRQTACHRLLHMIHRHLSVYSACDDTTCLETPIHTSGVDGQRRLSYVLPRSMPQDWMRVSRDGSILWPLTSGMPNRHRLRLRHHGGNRQHPHAPCRRHRPQCHLAASLQVTCRRGHVTGA